MAVETEKRPGAPITYLGVSSVEALFGGTPLRRDNIDQVHEYELQAQRKLHFWKGNGEYIVSAPALTGHQFNGVLHFAAPSKKYGYDTYDIISDWTNLYGDPSNQTRLNAHSRIPNWQHFAEKREIILDTIKGPRGSLLTPLIRLNVENGSSFRWNLKDLDANTQAQMEKLYITPRYPNVHLLPMLGPVFVGAYSPDITDDEKKWPKRMGYTPTGSDQDMGATQVLPLSLALCDFLYEGEFFQRITKKIQQFDPPVPRLEFIANTKGL